MGKPHQSLHEGELPRRVEFQSWDSLSRRVDGGLRELAKLSSVDKCFENVLLDIEVVLGNAAKLLPQWGKVVHCFSNTIILADVVGGGLGSKYPSISHILFDESVLVVASDNGVGQVEIFDGGL